MATQAEVATHLGLDERSIRNLQKIPGSPSARGRGGYDLDEWRYWYISYLRTMGKRGGASGPTSDDQTDEERDRESRELEMEERRLKVREKDINIRIKEAKLAQFEKSWAPIVVIEQALSRVASVLRSRHEGLIPKMKIACPDLSPEAVEVLEVELVAAANECADVSADLSDYVDSDSEFDPAWPELDAEDGAG
jgi:phage terminase Nu1 subunit (DNA packaging protein)